MTLDSSNRHTTRGKFGSHNSISKPVLVTNGTWYKWHLNDEFLLLIKVVFARPSIDPICMTAVCFVSNIWRRDLRNMKWLGFKSNNLERNPDRYPPCDRPGSKALTWRWIESIRSQSFSINPKRWSPNHCYQKSYSFPTWWIDEIQRRWLQRRGQFHSRLYNR